MHLDAFTSQIQPDKKVLVTGHTGFKGTWLTLLLERMGVEVCGLSLHPEQGSLFNRMNRLGSIEEILGDIRDARTVEVAINKFNPQVIFHLAAQPLVLQSYKEPRSTFETNVMGTVNLLDSATRNNRVQHISVITTDKVYRNENQGIRFTEEDALSGKDPYSASKVGTEAAVAAWRQLRKVTDGPSLVSLRAGNVIGGGDFAEDRLLPDLVRGFSNGEVVELRNPKSTRPWQHVLDPLCGYLLATAHIMNGNTTPAFNFAPTGESLPVSKVAEIAAASWGEGSQVIFSKHDDHLEAETLQLDASLAHTLLSWQPKWSQESAIKSTVEWWKSVTSGSASSQEACMKDIDFVLKENYLDLP